jgi:tRNA(Ile)-lysidine synthase
MVERLARTARNARISAGAMAMFIEGQSGDLIRDRFKMPVHKLLELDTEMQTLILRQWLRRHEIPVLPEQRLREFLKQLESASVESRAEVQWGDWMIKHYQLDLWLHRRKPFTGIPETAWRGANDIDLGLDTGQLALQGPPTRIPDGWVVRSRKSGDRIRVQPHGSRQKLKHFFQATSVPPWLRPGIPVLEWDGEPVALGDWIIGHRLQEWLLEQGLEFRWNPGDPVLSRVRADCQR